MAGNEKGAVSDGGINDNLSYKDDPRMPCRYGKKCYQKNKTHHEKYKHPPKKYAEEKDTTQKPNMSDDVQSCVDLSDNPASPPSKQRKLDEHEMEPAKVPTKLSESDSAESARKSTENMMPSSPGDPKENIKQKFLVEMPEDFYQFWKFCESLSQNNPSRALAALGLILVGPFDVLSGKLKNVKCRDRSSYLRHWRYYFDPPEFQTVIKGDDKKQYHIGYYRDDPKEMPIFVASNSAACGCTISPMAGNLFGALNVFMSGILKSGDPFTKVKVPKYQNALKEWAEKEGISLVTKTPEMNVRAKKVVATTFHHAGIVVPCDKKSQVGYRELIEPDREIKKILTSIIESGTDEKRQNAFSKLQPIVTAANIANDECDFGASLELGIDLFSFGGEVFHPTILALLPTAYSLLNRLEYGLIIKAHLEDRKKGADLSIVE